MKVDLSSFGEMVSDRKLSAFLLYGGEEALQEGLLAEIMRLFPTRTVEEGTFLGDPGAFLDPDLFSAPASCRILVVRGVSEKFFPAYREILAKSSLDRILVFTNLSMRANSACVRYFLGADHAGAVACYECNARQSLRIVLRFLRRHHMTLDREATEELALLTCDGSWADVFDRLTLYGTPVTEEAVRALGRTDIPALLTSFLGHTQADALSAFLDTLAFSPTQLLKVIRIWQRQVLQFLHIKALIASGLSFEESHKKAALFFKLVPLAEAQLSNWTTDALIGVLSLLRHAECSAKEGTPAWKMCLHRACTLQ